MLEPAAVQRFVYVLEGELEINGAILARGDYAYLPAGAHRNSFRENRSASRSSKSPISLCPVLPRPRASPAARATLPHTPLMGDDALEVRALVPDDASFDFAVNTMTYHPGATLPMVEIHVMEHGLLMLAGGGIYRLGDHWYPVTEGDFIWMAPYCPQWFGALGKTPAKYLIYKDWNR